MRVRMLIDVSGTRNGQPWPKRGETVDLPDAEAADYCRAGLCEPVAAAGGPVETATMPPAETRQGDAGEQAAKNTAASAAPAKTADTTAGADDKSTSASSKTSGGKTGSGS